MAEQAWCQIIECDADAEWDIDGETYSVDDKVQACTKHVGELLLDGQWNHVVALTPEPSEQPPAQEVTE